MILCVVEGALHVPFARKASMLGYTLAYENKHLSFVLALFFDSVVRSACVALFGRGHAPSSICVVEACGNKA